MLLMVGGMPFSDRLLLQYLRSRSGDQEVHLLYREIEADTGMSNSTVYRALDRLEQAGLIIRRPAIGKSYVYRVINDECA